jgi:hypothetical protein
MPLELTKKIKEADKETLVYWIKPNSSRSWPVNGDGDPLMDNGNPFPMTEDGLIAIPDESDTIDPSEDIDEACEANLEQIDIDKGQEIPDQVKIVIKMLSGTENQEITNAMIKTRTSAAKRKGKPRQATVEQDIDIGLSVQMKLERGIVDWEGIVDENGNPAPITKEYIELLPGWIQTAITDRISSLSELDEDLEGEL